MKEKEIVCSPLDTLSLFKNGNSTGMVHFLLPVLCLINQLGRDVRVQGSPTVPTLLALANP